MSDDLKQDLEVVDYFGPLIVFIAFFLIIFIISATCILWCCISDADDVGVYTKVSEKRILKDLEGLGNWVSVLTCFRV